MHQMTHLLSENILSDNKNKNIPHLTANQMSVIYKLIWYQDGYEQPSEEDLKRIEEVSWADESWLTFRMQIWPLFSLLHSRFFSF